MTSNALGISPVRKNYFYLGTIYDDGYEVFHWPSTNSVHRTYIFPPFFSSLRQARPKQLTTKRITFEEERDKKRVRLSWAVPNPSSAVWGKGQNQGQVLLVQCGEGAKAKFYCVGKRPGPSSTAWGRGPGPGPSSTAWGGPKQSSTVWEGATAKFYSVGESLGPRPSSPAWRGPSQSSWLATSSSVASQGVRNLSIQSVNGQYLNKKPVIFLRFQEHEPIKNNCKGRRTTYFSTMSEATGTAPQEQQQVLPLPTVPAQQQQVPPSTSQVSPPPPAPTPASWTTARSVMLSQRIYFKWSWTRCKTWGTGEWKREGRLGPT